ncbi:MAG: flavodoxin-dependent (E)-4-hydroxy-3-methylbut-2-enyl-diphosphate synthase [Elusimicrobia bacterium]|nr:flavodoxin-dependent (E)-4-hydroxy-3-methylbut-2-enyl-diphosphate synthase [Elusimicrobiota bacterium]
MADSRSANADAQTLSPSTRRKTRKVRIGKLWVGGGEPIRVQSMCTTDTRDVAATVTQIQEVEKVGCEIIRVAVPDMEAAQALGAIKKQIQIPLVADIHFDYRLALESIRQGVDKVRINPGNIGDRRRTEEVVRAAQSAGIPIRIGVNAGSLKILKEWDQWPDWDQEAWAEQMIREAQEQIEILNAFDFQDIVVSLKADDIDRVVLAYTKFSQRHDYPLHLGLTEAGTLVPGTIKSAVALSRLLSQGIGDTIRVSLTEDPVQQVKVAFEILKTLGLRAYGPEIIACPTCGRCEVDLFEIVREFENRLQKDPTLFQKAQGKKIAIMGCVVNGPGEAKDADFGIAGGKGVGAFIKKGKVSGNVPQAQWVDSLIQQIQETETLAPTSFSC